MPNGSVVVTNHLGLHLRPAAKLVKNAVKYRSSILLKRDDTGAEADARSMLAVLALAAPCGTPLSLSVEGDDADLAFQEITNLFANGFGDDV